ncbi:hypothetical protein ACFSCW_11600 [Sphingomonas tabacisoli]|uniref:Transporter n=1 Tax=Sphingomonas tabacisoli TaxID=2249466 RepID=A0ABW4I461_9SPHN
MAGPPYVTDDPEPTDLGHWEIYAFTAAEGAHGSWDGGGGLDLNYGAVKDVQLTATLPINATHARGAGTQTGAGNVELGVKYRFLHDVAGFDAAIFPRVILPSGGHRFGTGRTSLLLPLWIDRDIGHWAIFGGGGYTINPGAGNRDFWNGGLTVTREVSERLAIGGEVTVEGADSVGGHSTEGADLGGVYHIGGPFSLLVSGGPVHQHHGPTGWRGYAALGLAF